MGDDGAKDVEDGSERRGGKAIFKLFANEFVAYRIRSLILTHETFSKLRKWQERVESSFIDVVRTVACWMIQVQIDSVCELCNVHILIDSNAYTYRCVRALKFEMPSEEFINVIAVAFILFCFTHKMPKYVRIFWNAMSNYAFARRIQASHQMLSTLFFRNHFHSPVWLMPTDSDLHVVYSHSTFYDVQ